LGQQMYSNSSSSANTLKSPTSIISSQLMRQLFLLKNKWFNRF
jgi:hypothetical protein